MSDKLQFVARFQSRELGAIPGDFGKLKFVDDKLKIVEHFIGG